MYTQAHRRFSHTLPRSLQLAVRLQVGKGFRFTQLGRDPFYITACGASRDGYIYIYKYVTVGRAGPQRAYSLSARKTCGSRVENSPWKKHQELDWGRRNPTVFRPKAGTAHRGSRRSCRARELYDFKERSREKYVSHAVVRRGLKTSTTR